MISRIVNDLDELGNLNVNRIVKKKNCIDKVNKIKAKALFGESSPEIGVCVISSNNADKCCNENKY